MRRPDVLQEHRLAAWRGPDRLGDHVGPDRALERISHDQRRRGEIIGAAIGRDAAFEIAVAGKHADRDQVLVIDRLADRLGERAGIADAGRAAIADKVEAKRVEIVGKPAGLEIIGDHLAAGRKAGLDPRLGHQALLARLARNEAGGDQHRRVGGVGATGDRGDHDVAVADVIILAFDRDARVVVLLIGLLELGVELVVDLAQQHLVLRPLGAGKRRLDRRHVEFERVGEHGLGRIAHRATGPAPGHRP